MRSLLAINVLDLYLASDRYCTLLGFLDTAAVCLWSSIIIRSQTRVTVASSVRVSPVACSCRLTFSGIPMRKWCNSNVSHAGFFKPGIAFSRSFFRSCKTLIQLLLVVACVSEICRMRQIPWASSLCGSLFPCCIIPCCSSLSSN